MLVADRSPVYRRGLAAVLAEEPGWALVAQTGDAGAVVGLARVTDPAVALVDLDLPTATAVCERLRGARPDLPVVVIVESEAHPSLAMAVREGARGYLRRDAEPAQVRQTLAAAARGRALLAPAVTNRLLDELTVMLRRSEARAGTRTTLSPRELEVLALVAEGLSNSAVAEALFISESTVKNHMRSVHDKLGVRSRTQAVARATKEGLLAPRG